MTTWIASAGSTPGECAFGRRTVELQLARDPVRQAAEHQVGVGHRRPLTSAAVARRSRIGARALRPHTQRTARVTPDQRPPARADRLQVDRGQPERKPGDLALGRPAGLAADDQAHVRGRPAHVERDRILDPGQPRDPRRADHARSRSGHERKRRVRGRLSESRDPARGPHHERLGQPGRRAGAPERLEVAGDGRPEVGVDGRRRGPLVLAELRRDLVRRDDASARQSPPHLRGDRTLVRRIAKGEEQADRDRLHVVAEHRQRVELERRDQALGPDPLAHAVAALQRDERLGVRIAQPVQVRAVLAAQVKQVLEALRRHEGGAGPLALEERIRRDGRSVREPVEALRADGASRGQHRLLLTPRRRHLGRPQAVAREQHRVGEGPTDVHTEDGHRHDCLSNGSPHKGDP